MFIYVLINLGFQKNGDFKKLICMHVYVLIMFS
jgi:hypothetical protein